MEENKVVPAVDAETTVESAESAETVEYEATSTPVVLDEAEESVAEEKPDVSKKRLFKNTKRAKGFKTPKPSKGVTVKASTSKDKKSQEAKEDKPKESKEGQHEGPSLKQIERALNQENFKHQYRSTLKGTLGLLVSIAACAVLIATALLPVFKISGDSMSPNLDGGNIVLAMRNSKFDKGDIVAFYVNNKIFVKRIIGVPGDVVEIDSQGTVTVNDVALTESYLEEKSFGNCDIVLPYTVPDRAYFVLGDHRSVSLDSRSTEIGCIDEDLIIGKVFFRVWPLKDIGLV